MNLLVLAFLIYQVQSIGLGIVPVLVRIVCYHVQAVRQRKGIHVQGAARMPAPPAVFIVVPSRFLTNIHIGCHVGHGFTRSNVLGRVHANHGAYAALRIVRCAQHHKHVTLAGNLAAVQECRRQVYVIAVDFHGA